VNQEVCQCFPQGDPGSNGKALGKDMLDNGCIPIEQVVDPDRQAQDDKASDEKNK